MKTGKSVLAPRSPPQASHSRERGGGPCWSCVCSFPFIYYRYFASVPVPISKQLTSTGDTALRSRAVRCPLSVSAVECWCTTVVPWRATTTDRRRSAGFFVCQVSSCVWKCKSQPKLKNETKNIKKAPNLQIGEVRAPIRQLVSLRAKGTLWAIESRLLSSELDSAEDAWREPCCLKIEATRKCPTVLPPKHEGLLFEGAKLDVVASTRLTIKPWETSS